MALASLPARPFFVPPFSSIAVTAKFPTCLITSQISLRRYYFFPLFLLVLSFSLLFHPPLPPTGFPLSHRGGFRMSAMFDESGCPVHVLLDTFLGYLSRETRLAKNKLIKILLPSEMIRSTYQWKEILFADV